MLRLTNLALARGARTLYRGVTLTAAAGERVGLVGANGCGKTSLIAAVLGDFDVDGGAIEAPAPARIAHVAQDIETADQSALDYVLGGHAPLTAARAALAQAEAAHVAGSAAHDLELAHAHATLAEINEGAIVAQAMTVMRGLGFEHQAAARGVAHFSGGWRNRLALARALLRPAELLLLDEPTNHLDLDSVVWLEAWLRRQAATVLVISHDREFLDRCVNTIWHVADETMRRYAGNYSAFEAALIERNRQQDAAARGFERTSAHLKSFVDRFRAQATKARQAQSRLKMLQKLVEVEPVRARREWRFEFPAPRKLPDRLIDAEDLSLGYAGRAVLEGVDFVVRAGDRIGILGVNGAGKSTLVKAIAGSLAATAGELRRAPGVQIGYFAQHQLDQLRPEDTPLEHLRRLAPDTREQELRDFLGNYRFSGEFATAPVGRMSGGEKARCALALIAWARPNLLVLDEPTNHLDMETREALTMALSSFEGALLLVSHDRHLLRATADALWLVHDGRVEPFEGDLDEYASLVLASRRDRVEAEVASGPDSGRREERRQAAQQRERLAQARKPIQQRLQKTEGALERVGAELGALDTRLASPDFYHAGDADEVGKVLKRRGELATEQERLENTWLELQAELDAAGPG